MLRGLAKAALRPTIRQLLRDLASDEFGGEAHLDQVVEHLLRKIGGMPTHLGSGMAALTLLFEASGPAWHLLPPATRQARFESWRGKPVLGDWVVFWEKMGVFVFWSVVEEAQEEALQEEHG